MAILRASKSLVIMTFHFHSPHIHLSYITKSQIEILKYCSSRLFSDKHNVQDLIYSSIQLPVWHSGNTVFECSQTAICGNLRIVRLVEIRKYFWSNITARIL